MTKDMRKEYKSPVMEILATETERPFATSQYDSTLPINNNGDDDDIVIDDIIDIH